MDNLTRVNKLLTEQLDGRPTDGVKKKKGKEETINQVFQTASNLLADEPQNRPPISAAEVTQQQELLDKVRNNAHLLFGRRTSGMVIEPSACW